MKATPRLACLKRPRCQAFTRRDVVVVLAAVFLVVLVFLASRRQGSELSPRIQCLRNLKEIGAAFTTWAGDHDDQFPMRVSESRGGSRESALSGKVAPTFFQLSHALASNTLASPKILLCPEDAERSAAPSPFASMTDLKISYFIGLDADPTNSHNVLSGDRNIGLTGSRAELRGLLIITNADTAVWTKLLHSGAGNVGYADGSAQQATTRDLQNILRGTGLITNRLVVP